MNLRSLAWTCIAALTPTIAQAGVVLLGATIPNYDPGNTISLGINITNDVANDLASDLFSGYQVTLGIESTGRTTGSLSFGTATTPTSYVFPNSFGISTTFLNIDLNEVRVTDAKLPFGSGGVQLSTNQARLFEIPISASADATGTFQVTVMNTVGRTTEWTDSTQPTQLARSFSGLPVGSSITLGNLSPIPEPSAAIFLSLVFLSCASLKYFRCIH